MKGKEEEDEEEEAKEEEDGRLWDNLCESRIRKLAQPPHPTKVCSWTCFLPAHPNHQHHHSRNHPRKKRSKQCQYSWKYLNVC